MPGKPKRVVVAHVDHNMLYMAKKALDEAGYIVVGLSDNGPDAFNMVVELQPDVLLSSLFLLEEDGFKLVERIKNTPLLNMPAVAMFASARHESLINQVRDAGAFAAIEVPAFPEDVVAAVRIAGALERMTPYYAKEELVRNILDSMSIDQKMKGYEYLVTATGICCRSHKLFREMTTTVYPEVARLHGSTPTRVERCMRHAIDVAWTRGDINRQYEYFGNTIDGNRGKPTNSEFIARVIVELRLEASE